MKIAAWNIRNGGGKRIPAIADRLQFHQPDLIVLTEYRGVSGSILRKELGKAGYAHIHTTEPPPRKNGVAVISRLPIEPRPFGRRCSRQPKKGRLIRSC